MLELCELRDNKLLSALQFKGLECALNEENKCRSIIEKSELTKKSTGNEERAEQYTIS